jgi:hypothetical protein
MPSLLISTCHQQRTDGLCHRGAQWIIVVVTWCVLGSVIGWGLDRLLWRLSFNYVYPPNEFLRWFTKQSIAAGVIVAAMVTTGRIPVAPLAQVLRDALLCGLISLMLGVAWGVGATWLIERTPLSSEYLTPMRRVTFCSGLWRGPAAGFWLGTVGLAVRLLRFRHRLGQETILTGNQDA